MTCNKASSFASQVYLHNSTCHSRLEELGSYPCHSDSTSCAEIPLAWAS